MNYYLIKNKMVNKMSKKKFIYILSILLMVGIISIASNAKATNPEHLDLLYDEEAGHISIYAIHGVTDETKHFVDSLIIRVNGTLVSSQTFTSQESYNILHWDYYFADPVPTDGDTIHIFLTCYPFGGTYDKELILGHRNPGHELGFATTLPPVIVSTILVIIILLLPKLLIRDKEILVTK